MTTKMPMSLEEMLEAEIDGSGLHKVLEALSNVCNDKAEHILANWQDDGLSRMWRKRARELDKVAARMGRD